MFVRASAYFALGGGGGGIETWSITSQPHLARRHLVRLQELQQSPLHRGQVLMFGADAGSGAGPLHAAIIPLAAKATVTFTIDACSLLLSRASDHAAARARANTSSRKRTDGPGAVT